MHHTRLKPYRADLEHIKILDRVQLELSSHPIPAPWCIDIDYQARVVSIIVLRTHLGCRFTLASPDGTARLLPSHPGTPRPSQESLRKLFDELGAVAA